MPADGVSGVSGSLRQEQHLSQRIDEQIETPHVGVRNSLKAFAELLQAFNKPAGYGTLRTAPPDLAARDLPGKRMRPLVALQMDEVNESEYRRRRTIAETLELEAEQALLEADKLEVQAAQLRKQVLQNCSTAATNQEADPASSEVSDNPETSREAAPMAALPITKVRTTAEVNRIAQLFKDKAGDALQLSAEQIQAAKTHVFNLDSFYVSTVERTDIGTIFRGSLRANSSTVIERVNSRLLKVPELHEVRFLFLEDPLSNLSQVLKKKEQRDTVFLALPAEAVRINSGVTHLLWFWLGGFISLISTVVVALSAYSLSDDGAILRALRAGDPGPLQLGIPIGLGLCALQLLHELAHSIAAKHYDMEIGLPTWVPSLQLGTFGSVTRLLSPPKNRKALFDFALAGPVFAGAVSLAIYLLGLSLSVDLPEPNPAVDQGQDGITILRRLFRGMPANMAGFGDYVPYVMPDTLTPVVTASLLKSSALLGGLAELVLPGASTAPYFALHPLAVIGFCGCLVNALQLVPIGRLDGGRAATALAGYEVSRGVTAFLFLLQVFTNFTKGNPILCFFALFAITQTRGTEEVPCADEITEVGSTREAIAFVVAAAVLLTLLPLPVPLGGFSWTGGSVMYPDGGTFPRF